ncbi:MAG: protein-export rane protein SecD/SecF family, partial [Acidimicrobiales bacterium]|nr:protein-export rane protein SecD/SecF family [Acidimicrobiales bacterium]
MTRRGLMTSLVFMIVVALAAVGLSAGTKTKPILGLDLQGGFSVVLQAKPVNGVLPSEESVEKAKDIIRQRVDGLGVAEPDITRQGRTVIVQLPGVKNREKAEQVVGCTARLEFRPVLAIEANPDFVPSTTAKKGSKGSTTTTTKGEGAGTTTTAPTTTSGPTSTAPATTTVGGSGEGGFGTVGAAPGEGALPVQFAPTTTTSTTTTPPTTTAPAPPATTTTVAPPTTTTAPGATTT